MTKLNEMRRLIIERDVEIITAYELHSLGYSKSWLKYALKVLVREKTLYRLKKGMYSKTNPESMDLFKTATLLFGGYLGLSTAAYIHGWTDEYQYTIFVLTDKTSKKMNLCNHEFRAISVKKRFSGSCYYNNYVVSTKWKTVFDLLYFIDIFGASALKYISNAKMSKKEWKDFIRYAKSESKSFRQKTGYILEKLNKNAELQQLIPKKPVVVKLGKGSKSKFDKKWKVLDYMGVCND